MARFGLGGLSDDAHPEREALSAFVDGELDAVARARVERHVRDCLECRRTVQEFRGQSDLFQRVPAVRPPLSLRRDLYDRIDEEDRRRRPFGLPFPLPLPSANVLGVALAALLLAMVTPQLMGMWAALSTPTPDLSQRAAAPETSPLATPMVSEPTPTAATAPTVAPTVAAQPTAAPAAPTAAPVAPAAAPPASPSPTDRPPAAPTPAATPAASRSTTSTSQGGAPTPAVTGPPQPAGAKPTVAATPTAAVQTRAVAGQVTNVDRRQRLVTVQAATGGDGKARVWQVAVTDGTLITAKDGRALQFGDIGFADMLEVSGFEVASGPLMAASLRVVQSAVLLTPPRPKVLVLLDGAPGLRSPQFGFTGDWIKRLNDTGHDVTAVDPATISSGTANLGDFGLVVIGYPATMSDRALQAVKASKLPVLNAEPRLVQALGLGQNVDQARPTHMVAGRTVEVVPSTSPLTRGFTGDTVVGGELYRTPIVANGTVLGAVTDGGQRRAVWSLTGNVMYFGFWYSANGQNHNATYWTFFDRSVLHLLGKDPLASPAPR